MGKKSLGMKCVLAMLALTIAAGCFDIEGIDPKPSEHRTEYLTSGFTLGGCQQNLDKLAGTHVQMTQHSGSPFIWIYLGLLPAYTCRGFVEMPPSAK